jgi:hypothetical protein
VRKSDFPAEVTEVMSDGVAQNLWILSICNLSSFDWIHVRILEFEPEDIYDKHTLLAKFW